VKPGANVRVGGEDAHALETSERRSRRRAWYAKGEASTALEEFQLLCDEAIMGAIDVRCVSD
jgi:hypothetical protein